MSRLRKRWHKKLGVKAEFTTTEWSGILAGLSAGKYDVIVNQVGITAKRQESFDFSDPYVLSQAQLVVRKDDSRNFKTLDDLKGKKKWAWARAPTLPRC